MTSGAISGLLKDCGCYEYKEYFAGKTMDELYRCSLKDLAQILPLGAKWPAYKIHNQLFLAQRSQFETWLDPRYPAELQIQQLYEKHQKMNENSQSDPPTK